MRFNAYLMYTQFFSLFCECYYNGVCMYFPQVLAHWPHYRSAVYWTTIFGMMWSYHAIDEKSSSLWIESSFVRGSRESSPDWTWTELYVLFQYLLAVFGVLLWYRNIQTDKNLLPQVIKLLQFKAPFYVQDLYYLTYSSFYSFFYLNLDCLVWM